MTAAHPGMRGVRMDVTNPAGIAALAVALDADFPKLNVLINNAGISRMEDLTAEEVDLDTPRAIVQTNIVGVVELTAALLPILRRQSAATIITTSSGLAFVPRSNFPTYCAGRGPPAPPILRYGTIFFAMPTHRRR